LLGFFVPYILHWALSRTNKNMAGVVTLGEIQACPLFANLPQILFVCNFANLDVYKRGEKVQSAPYLNKINYHRILPDFSLCISSFFMYQKTARNDKKIVYSSNKPKQPCIMLCATKFMLNGILPELRSRTQGQSRIISRCLSRIRINIYHVCNFARY
jgi:hypothetical protein